MVGRCILIPTRRVPSNSMIRAWGRITADRSDVCKLKPAINSWSKLCQAKRNTPPVCSHRREAQPSPSVPWVRLSAPRATAPRRVSPGILPRTNVSPMPVCPGRIPRELARGDKGRRRRARSFAVPGYRRKCRKMSSLRYD